MEWALLTVAGLAALVYALSRLARPQPPAGEALAPRGAPRHASHPTAWGVRLPSRLPAEEMLRRAQSLSHARARWERICSELNPGGDPAVAELLIELRGPHLLTPHLGLGVLEDGCRRALAATPAADAVAALRAAVRSAGLFAR